MPPKTLKAQVELGSRALVKRLREAVQPPGKKGLWLRHLSDRKLLEVYYRLRAGQASHRICKLAQVHWGVMPQSATKTLAQGLRKFRDKVIGLIPVEKHTATVEGAKERRKKAVEQSKRAMKIAKKVDGMEVMANLIDLMWGRVQAMAAAETKKDFFRGTDSAVKILGEILGKFIQFEMDLGILDARAPELTLKLKHSFDGILRGVVKDDGARLIAATQKLLKSAEEDAVEMKITEDGKYAPADFPESEGLHEVHSYRKSS